MREDSRKKKNSGFTLVEVLIAVAILAVVTIPVIQSFVSVAQVNGKSRRRLSAMTVAESVMEACKSMSLTEFAAQCGYFGNVPFTIVSGQLSTTPGGSSISSFSGSAAELKQGSTEYVVVSSNSEKSAQPIATNSKQYKLVENTGKKYCFWISEIEMGGGKYDVIVTYTMNLTRKSTQTGTGVYDPYEDLSSAGLRTLRYYDVQIEVYRSLGSLHDTVYGINSVKVATLNGSVTDYIEPKAKTTS